MPAIRAAIAVDLVKCGVSQTQAARLMEIAPSAVSQYLSGRRGYRVEFNEEAKEAIRSLAWDLKEGRVENLGNRICEICKQVRGEGDRCGTGQESPEP